MLKTPIDCCVLAGQMFATPKRSAFIPVMVLVLVGSFACAQANAWGAADVGPAWVPVPQSVTPKPGAFELSPDAAIVIPADEAEALQTHAAVLSEAIRRLSGLALPVRPGGRVGPGDIELKLGRYKGPEGGYRLDIARSVSIEGRTINEIANGTATLLHLIGSAKGNRLSAMSVRDAPDSGFRCFMVDLGRNPHSLQSLKQAVDWLWLYKVNYLQLHLTDDQRFAFPSKAFPKLNANTPDFTVEELKELDRYAAARGVSIIPELEAPGHSGIMRGQHPEVFGKTPSDLANTPKAREGLKTLIDEMLAVFQTARYMHIGCDEAFGVSAEDQRDLVNYLNKHVKSRGKTTIVWEGPHLGEGANKVDTDVIHMAWEMRYFSPDKMLEAGYAVVNAGWDPLYIVDHYPRNNFTMTSPEHIYGLTRHVFEHVAPGLPGYAEPIVVPEKSSILGFCMPWWEGRERNFLNLCPPRIAPMGARAWNPKGEKDYKSFATRYQLSKDTLQRISTPVAISADPLAIESARVFHRKTKVTLACSVAGDIYYTTDGSDPTAASARYSQPIEITQTATVRAAVFEDGKRLGQISEALYTYVDPVDNLALGKPVRSSLPSDEFFCVERLTDGGTGKFDFYLGYMPEPNKPAVIEIDLEAPTELNRIVVTEYTNGQSYEDYELFLSLDGKQFKKVAQSTAEPKPEGAASYTFNKAKARYIRLKSKGHHHAVFYSFSKFIEVQAFND